MPLTKVTGGEIDGASSINVTGIVTATSFSGDVSGNINSSGVSTFSTLRVGTGVTISSGVVTATSFVGNLTGNVTGNVTGNATGLSGTPSISVDSITAATATFTGNVSVAGTVTYEDVTNIDSIGIVTARGGLQVGTGGTVITTTTGGLVGIGTINPTSKLQVQNGGILVKGATTPNINFEPAGTLGNADISFDGSTFTLVSNSSSAAMLFNTNSTERVRITSSGDVGIGTGNPQAKLQVNQTSLTAPSITFGASAGQIFRNESAELAFGLGNASPYPLWIQGRYSNNSARDIVLNPLGGNLGIGTNNPSGATVDIFAGGTTSGFSLLRISNLADGASAGFLGLQKFGSAAASYGPYSANNVGIDAVYTQFNLGTQTSHPLVLYTNNTERVRIDSSGNVGLGTTSPISNLHINSTTSRSIVFTGNTGASFLVMGNKDSGGTSGPAILTSANRVFRFGVGDSFTSSTGGTFTEYMRLDASGNLGIGTINPQAPLHVVGTGATTLIVEGNARVTGILSVGQGTITINGNTDKITVPKLDYAGISSTISDTVVDVFVYDTRKDSDGGAWRKRTQHTSWYNETLNTATRGSRRDFPAVAVIVTTLTTVTIYDGDDPDMPMWMVFEGATVAASGMSGTRMLQYASQQGYFVHALNGILVIGQKTNNDNYGSAVIRFISEYVNRMDPQTGTEGGVWNGSIADRNTNAGYRVSSTETYGIVNSIINDVAMTVLPNAPIDSTTGLPVPTIAVATKGGISIITDSGTVYNLTPESEPAYASIKNFFSVGFDSNQKPFFTDTQTGSGYSQLIYLPNYTYNQSLSDTYSYLSGSYNYAWDSYTRTTTTTVGYWAPNNPYRLIKPSVATRDSIAIGYTGSGLGGDGLSLIGQQDNYLMNCGITTTFNTGWLYGYTQGAFLSDINATNVTGTELVTNGTFASGTTGWSSSNGGSLSVVSGALRINANGNAYGGATQTLPTLVVGKTYVLSADIGTISNASAFTAIVRDSIGTLGATYPTSNQKTSIYFTARQASGTYILFESPNDSDAICDIDNVSVRITEADRSINDKGLAVYGTITKTAVATGADLVSYSGIGTTSFLEQPYNSSAASFDFGTGNFSIMGWINTTLVGGGQFIFYRSTNGTLREFELWIAADLGYMSIYLGGTGLTTPNYVIPNSTWTHFCALRNSGGVVQIYINGVSVVSGNITSNVNTTNPAKILWNCDTSTKLSLLRISGSVPTTDQIKKIYNDEKALFQINSKAVLYGTSSAVTALAYDDSTKLLHVGTSSGRSDFQGLERINNTTTAVTTAISASNGLIAEQ